MIKKPIVIRSKQELNARPIALLVQEASQYDSKVYIEVDNKKINVKSIMGMMSLQVADGKQVTVIADGGDEQEALSGVERLLVSQG